MTADEKIAIVEQDIAEFMQLSELHYYPWVDEFLSAANVIWPEIKDRIANNPNELLSVDQFIKEARTPGLPVSVAFRFMNYLSGERAQMLTMIFQFRDGDATYDVSNKIINDLLLAGSKTFRPEAGKAVVRPAVTFYHPETGEPVSSPMEKIHMVYQINA